MAAEWQWGWEESKPGKGSELGGICGLQRIREAPK